MKKHLILITLLFSAFLHAADIWTYDNARLPDGRPLIIPEPQQYIAKPGIFQFPQTISISVPQEEQLIFTQLQKELARLGVATQKKNDHTECTFELSQENVPDSPEGYRLAISEKGIRIVSRSNAGLFYGAQTLRSLLANAAKPQLECCEIFDYPDLEHRLYTMMLHNVKNEQLPKLKLLLDTMGRLKLNGLSLTVAEAFPYESFKLTKSKNILSREALAELRDYCRERHITIIPALQFLSHNSWLMAHEDWEKMSEGKPDKTWNSQACIQNEQARAITLQAMREQIAFFNAKIAYVVLDEIYLGPFKVCPRCKDVPAMELLTDYMNFIHKGLADTGCKIMFCHDCFNNLPNWPYGEEMRKLLDPKTDLIGFWSYREFIDDTKLLPLQQFHPTGTAIAGMPKNVRNMIEVIKRNHGTGIRMTHWYFSSGGSFADLNRETPESTGGFVIGADYIWHNRPTHHGFLTYDATHEMMRMIAPEYAEHFFRPTILSGLAEQKGVLQSHDAQPVSLQPYINSELSESGEFPVLNEEMAQQARALLQSRPERFQLVIGEKGRYYGVRLSGNKNEEGGRDAMRIELGLGGREAMGIVKDNFSILRLSLLMTSTRPTKIADYTSTNYGKYRFTPKQAAVIRFEYEDGTGQDVPLAYRYDFNDWNSAFGGYNMKLALRGIDCNGNFFTFGICDVINPAPNKPVKSVLFRTLGWDGISPVLLALTTWDSAFHSQMRPPVKPFVPTTLQKKPYTAKKGFDRKIIYDFENGVVEPVYLTQNGNFQGKITMEVVELPQHGKVLKVSVPPAVANETNPFVRVSIDMPYRISEGCKGLVKDCRLSHLEGFSHSMEYLNTRNPGPIMEGNARFWSKKTYADDQWNTTIASLLDKPTECDLDDKSLAKTRRISFFFKRLDKSVEIYLDNIGETPSEWQFAPMWSPDNERDRHY
ncbi:MAG: beta-N-acetylhexosaminidase [Victivallales bacterium]|nr:beta-N-acetylhexosaminidase [Victivallales bacterium]